MSMDSIINDDFVKDVSNSENTASKTEYDINTLIYELIQYGKMNEIIKPDDNIYYVNKLMAFFRLDDYNYISLFMKFQILIFLSSLQEIIFPE